MPILKKLTLRDPSAKSITFTIVETHYEWAAGHEEASYATYLDKFHELADAWNINDKFRDHVWHAVNEHEFIVLRNWYKPQASGPDADFEFLSNDVFAQTPNNAIQERLIKQLKEWEQARPPPGPLAEFVRDRQNIHTASVAGQQNRTMEILKAVPVPKGQQTMDEITTAWVLSIGWTTGVQAVLKDMREWGAKSYITEEGDYMYRTLLRHLWAKIKASDKELQKELITRLFEEGTDSIGMCSMGHIGRLCNVLAGYVEGVQSPVNSKELFQEEIARLSTEERSIAEKIAVCHHLFEQYAIPIGEHSAWLEALAD